MTTKVEIWNLALGHVRAQPVGAENEDSAAARTCATYYPTVLEMALSESPWKFATRWMNLPLLTDKTEGWDYAYQLPADFLRVWRVRTNDCFSGPGFLPENSDVCPPANRMRTEYGEWSYDLVPLGAGMDYSLVANITPLSAKITFVVDEGLFPAPFVMALSHLLAVYIAVPLSGIEVGGVSRDKQFNMYRSALAAANEGDSAHQQIRRPPSRYIDVRW